MIRRPPRSTPLYSSAASDVYKRQALGLHRHLFSTRSPRPDRQRTARHHRTPVSYTHLRAHETKANLVCRLLLEKKKKTKTKKKQTAIKIKKKKNKKKKKTKKKTIK